MNYTVLHHVLPMLKLLLMSNAVVCTYVSVMQGNTVVLHNTYCNGYFTYVTTVLCSCVLLLLFYFTSSWRLLCKVLSNFSFNNIPNLVYLRTVITN